MAGGNPNKGSSNHPSSSHHTKSHRESAINNPQKPSPSNPPSNTKHKPSPKLNPNPNTIPIPIPSPRPRPEVSVQPPPPSYGFHMLDRRTIVLADGSGRSYFALPSDYQDLPMPRSRAPIRPQGFDPQFPPGRPIPGADDRYRKRKFGDERDEVNDAFAGQRQQLVQYGNMNSSSNGSHMAGPSSRVSKHMRPDVDESKLKSAFLSFIRLISESANQKKYTADGKQGSLQCLACGRSSKDFPDLHSLVMHTYNPEKSTFDQVSDHLGFHKALCVLMRWNYQMPPDNSKAYQRLSADEAAADRDDLIMWPPHVIIHNTATKKGRDGRVEGLANKAMDMKLRDLGFTTGKSKSMYGRDGHTGTTVVKFSNDQSGLKDATRLADFFDKQNHGRRSWAAIRSSFRPGKDEEKDSNFVKLDKKSGQKERIFYAYLGTVFDLDDVDFDTRKSLTVESRRDRANRV